jgi:hypothetical protein
VMVADGALSIREVAQRIKEAMESSSGASVDLMLVYLILGHPAMRLNASFVELVSYLLSPLFLLSPPLHLNSVSDLTARPCRPRRQSTAVGRHGQEGC